MKKIRTDYYRYRMRKGRADILLQRSDGENEYCIPHKYVEAEEKIAHVIKASSIEDDVNGDLVILDYALQKNRHLKRDGKEWVPLKDTLKIDFPGNELYHVNHNILRLFMDLSPEEADPSLVRSVSEMLETVKVNIAKKKYVAELQAALERENWVIPDAHMTPPDPELIRKEIKTLEHFRLDKTYDRYSYEPIDWEDFGAVTTYIDLPGKGDSSDGWKLRAFYDELEKPD